ncbi:hypothetical protein AC249_AIPGENE15250 [Exaiptasia diaphana]|nr:hypothetical protein AC249_AIPGENE15250 [Exaiptasia diaphana]
MTESEKLEDLLKIAVNRRGNLRRLFTTQSKKIQSLFKEGNIESLKIAHRKLTEARPEIQQLDREIQRLFVLLWLDSRKWLKVFVQNRKAAILKLTDVSSWTHVRSADNPADILARGCTTKELEKSKLWRKGPSWLPSHRTQSSKQSITLAEDEEMVFFSSPAVAEEIVFVSSSAVAEDYDHVEPKPRPFTAGRQKGTKTKLESHVSDCVQVPTSEEIAAAEYVILKLHQAEHFKHELNYLEDMQHNSQKPKPNLVRQLNLMLNEDGLIVARGRLEHSNIQKESREPILIAKSQLITLLIQSVHNRQLHAGIGGTVVALRRRFWLPSARQVVKSILRKCVNCRYQESKPYLLPPSPPLPDFRLNSTRPFQVVGIDFTGHLTVKTNEDEEMVFFSSPAVAEEIVFVSSSAVAEDYDHVEPKPRPFTRGRLEHSNIQKESREPILMKYILTKCVNCRYQESKPYLLPPSPPLPDFRLNSTRPFQVVGIDFTGHLTVKTNGKNQSKCYICLFACSTTRKVNLEVVTDMTTDQFLQALRRHCAVYGVPSVIICDNAKTFIKADEELSKLLQSLNDPKVQTHLAHKRIKMRRIPNKSPHWGGMYERLIGIVKMCLKKILHRSLICLSELQTLVKEVQAVVNDRPMTFISSDINDPQPLRPSKLLYVFEVKGLPHPDVEDLVEDYKDQGDLTKAMKRRALLFDIFDQRFKSEYLSALRERHTYQQKKGPHHKLVQLGDVVLINNKDLPRINWKLAIVILFCGPDGNVRAAELVTNPGITNRSIHLLHPLEVHVKDPDEFCSASKRNSNQGEQLR